MEARDDGSPAEGRPYPRGDHAVVALAVAGPVTYGDVPGLCRRAREVLAGLEPGSVVLCDVSALGAPDAAAVEALARVQLTARRMGCRVRLRGAGPGLVALLERAGLRDALGCDPGTPDA